MNNLSQREVPSAEHELMWHKTIASEAFVTQASQVVRHILWR